MYPEIPLFHPSAFEVIGTSTKKMTDAFTVGSHPAGICISPDGKLVFISCEDENLVYVFNLDKLAVQNKIRTGNGADAMICLYHSELT